MSKLKQKMSIIECTVYNPPHPSLYQRTEVDLCVPIENVGAAEKKHNCHFSVNVGDVKFKLADWDLNTSSNENKNNILHALVRENFTWVINENRKNWMVFQPATKVP